MKNLLLTQENLEKFKRGDKTQIRRLHGLKEINENPDDWVKPFELDCEPGLWTIRNYKTGAVIAFKPRYHVGEVVFVGEPWHYINIPEYNYGIEYADGEIRWWADNGNEMNYPLDEKPRSPRFMFAKYARTHARITSVGCGRLWDMTEADCIAEGIEAWASNLWVLIYGIERVEL